MMRKTIMALFAVAAVGLVQPTAAFARGGGGGGHGGGGGGHGGGFGGGGFHAGFAGGGFHGGGFHGRFAGALGRGNTREDAVELRMKEAPRPIRFNGRRVCALHLLVF